MAFDPKKFLKIEESSFFYKEEIYIVYEIDSDANNNVYICALEGLFKDRKKALEYIDYLEKMYLKEGIKRKFSLEVIDFRDNYVEFFKNEENE